MTVQGTSPTDLLEPVRLALQMQAETEAAEVLAAADAEAAAVRERAGVERDRIRDEALAQGEADGQSFLAGERARSSRQARATILRAKREVFEALRAEVTSSVVELKSDPAYPTILRRLSDEARDLLGREADVVESPDGGVIATAGTRRVTWTLPTLAEQALEVQIPDIERLWSP